MLSQTVASGLFTRYKVPGTICVMTDTPVGLTDHVKRTLPQTLI